MGRNLEFDVLARGETDELLVIAGQLKDLAKQVRDLDGKQARAKVEVTGAEKATAQTRQVTTDLRGLDGRTARAKVEVTGAETAEVKATGFAARLRAIPNTIRTRLSLDVDGSAAERVAALTTAARRFGDISGQAAGGVARLRSVANFIVNPDQIPVVDRVSTAIAGRFHQAVDAGEKVVAKLRTGLAGLRTTLIQVGAAGNAVQVLGAAATSVAQLSGAALLAPAALLGAAAAGVTLKTAFAGFGDAMKAKDAKAFAEATQDMAPAARRTAAAFRGLREDYVSVQKAVQAKVFDRVATQVRTLGGTYLPVLRTGLSGVGQQLNGMVLQGTRAAQSVGNIGAVRSIITNTDRALGGMRSTLANAVTGFLTLGGAGSSWLPRIGQAIDTGSAKFKAWTTRITSDGSFDRWVHAGVTAFSQLFTILRNVGSIVGTVFSALNTNGAGLLATLATATG